MKKIIKNFITFILLVSSVRICYGGYGRTAGNILFYPFSTSITGAGEVYEVPHYQDGFAALYNPAFLYALPEYKHVTVSYRRGIMDDSLGMISYSEIAEEKAWAEVLSVGLVYYDAGTAEMYDLNGELKKFNAERDYLLFLGIGGKGEKPELAGLNLKILISTLAEKFTTISFAGFDLGCRWITPEFEMFGTENKIILDYCFQNLLNFSIYPFGELKYKNAKEDIPISLKCGANWKMNIEDTHKISAGINLEWREYVGHLNPAFGVEYMFKDLFMLRTGLNTKGYTCGFGINIQPIKFDYAFTSYQQLESVTHNISLMYKF